MFAAMVALPLFACFLKGVEGVAEIPGPSQVRAARQVLFSSLPRPSQVPPPERASRSGPVGEDVVEGESEGEGEGEGSGVTTWGMDEDEDQKKVRTAHYHSTRTSPPLGDVVPPR